MTVAAGARSASYLIAAGVTAYAIPFDLMQATDLLVYQHAAATFDPDYPGTLLTAGVQYSVPKALTTIVPTTAFPKTGSITLYRQTSRAQTAAYAPNDGFPAKAHEAQLDRLSLVTQEIDDTLADVKTRALLAAPGEEYPTLPSIAERAGKVLGFMASTGKAIAVALGAISIGVISVVPAGGTPAVTNSGTAFNPTLDFALPSAMDGVNVELFGAIFDGRDNTAKIQQALNWAFSHGYKRVICPAGATFLSATLTVPPGVSLCGQGPNVTFLRRTGDYGDTIHLGTPGVLAADGSYDLSGAAYQAGGLYDLTIYHDYGTGLFPPNTAAGMVNPTTKGVHVFAYQPSHVGFANLWIIGCKGQWKSWGGTRVNFTGCEFIGLYDPKTPALQESLSSIFIDGDGTAIPTGFAFDGCSVGGTVSPPRTASWPGGKTTANLPENIGALDAFFVRCGEGIVWSKGYLGAGARSNVRVFPRNITKGLSFRDHYADSAGFSQLLLDGSAGINSTHVTWAPMDGVGQFNGFCAVSDAPTNPTGNWACIGLTIEGPYLAFVGPVFDLKRCAKVTIKATVSQWNAYGYYTGNAGGLGYDCGARIGDNCRTVGIYGVFGGGAAGDGSGSPASDAYAVRYTATNNPANVTLYLALGTGTQASATVN